MSSILPLLVPTVLSALAVFVLSSILHMVVPAWHRSDYPTLPDEDAVLDALRPLAIPPGEYMAPRPADGRDMKSADFLEKMNRGPVIMLNVHTPGTVPLSRPLVLWFVYLLIVAWASGHVAWGAFRDHNDPIDIFHTVGLTALMGYALALWQGTIWYRRPWLTSLKSTIDGVLYAVVTALIFVYCWPAS